MDNFMKHHKSNNLFNNLIYRGRATVRYGDSYQMK